MKKILFIAIILLAGCGETPIQVDKSRTINAQNSTEKQRIKGKGSFTYDGIFYQIIEVDGVEYLTQYGGGIVCLEKDSTKSKD